MSRDWTTFTARRPPADVVHLDTAAAGRMSTATLDATAAHARLEATTGAYVAQRRAEPTLQRLHADLGDLLGLPAAAVALVESATAALRRLLEVWPLRAGARVGVVAGEWGPNLEHLHRRGYRDVRLDVDGDGRLDVEALQQRLRTDPPDVVHLTHVASHRGLRQPVADAARVCRDAGVPLWVDAAQALGHVDCAVGADAVYATSRKWLTGPRGVGVLAVAEHRWDALDVLRPALDDDPSRPPTAFLESHEANVPGRIGLATAVRELVGDGPAAVFARLAEVGGRTAAALGDVDGWAVVGTPAGAITALRPTAGQDVFAVRERLLDEHRILTTPAQAARAPLDMREPLLRISPHVDVTDEQLTRLGQALSTLR